TDLGGSNSQNGVFTTFGSHPFGISSTGISVPTQNSFNPFTTADYTSNGGFSSTFPRFSQQSAAPPGTEFTTGVRYRSLEAGLRTLKITTNNYLFTGGLKGNLGEFANAWDQLKTWEWETAVRYNESYRTVRFGGIVNNYALRNRLLDTDPATGPTWNFPGAYSLELGYAEREEWYSDFGDTQRPKFDVRWQPIDQSLTLRAAYIEAFHAPSLFELFGGRSQTFPIISDPFT